MSSERSADGGAEDVVGTGGGTDPGPAGVDGETVAAYLRRHPEFFRERPALVAELRVPHDAGGAVSLVEHQLAVLRDQSQRQRRRLRDLTAVARENEELWRRLHRLTLSLVDCARIDDVFALLSQSLLEDFRADTATVRLFAAPRSADDAGLGEFLGPDHEGRALFEPVLETGRPVCGRLRPEQLELLFAEQAPGIASAALLPLGDRVRFGVVAIGSRDPGRFHPGMGTMFLRHLAEIVTCVVSPHVAPTRAGAA